MQPAIADTPNAKPARARTRTETREDEKAEGILMAWAEWCHFKLTAQGFGGGVDFEGARMPRAPGTHGDPVLAEVLATSYDDQSEQQMTHEIIRRYSKDWRKVAWARWVGVPEVKTFRTERVPTVKRAGERAVSLEKKVPASVGWSGLQPYIAVSKQTGIPQRTCERIVAQLKRLIVLDVAAEQHYRRSLRLPLVENLADKG